MTDSNSEQGLLKDQDGESKSKHIRRSTQELTPCFYAAVTIFVLLLLTTFVIVKSIFMLGNKEERRIQDVCVPNVAAKFSSAENDLFKQAFKTTVSSAHCADSLFTRAHDMDIEFITALAIGAGQSDATYNAELGSSQPYTSGQLSERGNTLHRMCKAIGPNNCVKHSKSPSFVVGALTNAAFYWIGIIAATEKIVATNPTLSGGTTTFPSSGTGPANASDAAIHTSTASALTQNSDDSCVSSSSVTATSFNIHSLFDNANVLFAESEWSVNLCTAITEETIIKTGLA